MSKTCKYLREKPSTHCHLKHTQFLNSMKSALIEYSWTITSSIFWCHWFLLTSFLHAAWMEETFLWGFLLLPLHQSAKFQHMEILLNNAKPFLSKFELNTKIPYKDIIAYKPKEEMHVGHGLNSTKLRTFSPVFLSAPPSTPLASPDKPPALREHSVTWKAVSDPTRAIKLAVALCRPATALYRNRRWNLHVRYRAIKGLCALLPILVLWPC